MGVHTPTFRRRLSETSRPIGTVKVHPQPLTEVSYTELITTVREL